MDGRAQSRRAKLSLGRSRNAFRTVACVGEVHEVPVKSKCWLGWRNPEVRLFWVGQEWEVESDGSSEG